VLNATALVPARDDKEQEWYGWPSLRQRWLTHLPNGVKDALILLAPRVLLARERKYWEDRSGSLLPVVMLTYALQDPDFRGAASAILLALIDTGSLEAFGCEVEDLFDDDVVEQMREWAREDSSTTAPFFSQLLTEFEPWAQGRAVNVGQAPPYADTSVWPPNLKP
jgi:hypothetical protein